MSSVCVGNDVVDLENPRTEGRSSDHRFVARVFDDQERAVIASSADPDLELWCHWAAKEAGFKAISKLVGRPPPFVHRAFAVSWDAQPHPDVRAAADAGARRDGSGAPAATVIRRGRVEWQDHRAEVSVALHPGSLHAVAHATRPGPERPVAVRPRVAPLDLPDSPWAGALEDLLPRFTEREADAVYSLSSAAVRMGARRELAELLGVAERRLEIVCAPGRASQRPPRVLLDGEETEADVSLSHDGRLIAWALWVDLPAANPERKDAS